MDILAEQNDHIHDMWCGPRASPDPSSASSSDDPSSDGGGAEEVGSGGEEEIGSGGEEVESMVERAGSGDAANERPIRRSPVARKAVIRRVSDISLAELTAFDCGCVKASSGNDCRRFMDTGDACAIRRHTWETMTDKERKIKLIGDLERNIVWDSGRNRWDFTFNLNYHRVCLKLWAKVHGFAKSTLQRRKTTTVENAEANRLEQVIFSGNAKGEDTASLRDLSGDGKVAISWLAQYATEAGEKMPIPMTTKVVNDPKVAQLYYACFNS